MGSGATVVDLVQIVDTLGSGASFRSLIGAQAADGDLTSLAAANAIGLYYRSAADTWSIVTIGSGLAFSGGTLSASGGGSYLPLSGGTLTGLLTLNSTAQTAKMFLGGSYSWIGSSGTNIVFGLNDAGGNNPRMTLSTGALALNDNVLGLTIGTSSTDVGFFKPSASTMACRTATNGADAYFTCATCKTASYTVATLPSASSVGAGARAYVTDSNSTTYNATVAGGGANKVGVISDGTNWKIG